MPKPNERHKTAIITWVVVYPLITMLLYLLEPIVHGWPVPLRTLVLTLIMIPILVFWAMPAATDFFHNFQKFNESDGQSRSIRPSKAK